MATSKPRLVVDFADADGPEDGNSFDALRTSMQSAGALQPQLEMGNKAGARGIPEMAAAGFSILTTLSSPEVIAAVLAVIVQHLLRNRKRLDHPIKAYIKAGEHVYEVTGQDAEEVIKNARDIERKIKAEHDING
jgi:hypothetical protein